MENLENYGVQELGAMEVVQVDGGLMLGGWGRFVRFTYDFLKFCSEHGPDYSGRMHVIP